MAPSPNPEADYERVLSGELPVYSTRLVCEYAIPYSGRLAVASPLDLSDLLCAYFRDKDREEVVAVLLCEDKTVLGLARVSVGTRNRAPAMPAQVFKAAFLANASSIILAHNHPNGNAEPGDHDVRVTRLLMEAGELLELPVLDHLVVGDEGVVSIAEILMAEATSP